MKIPGLYVLPAFCSGILIAALQPLPGRGGIVCTAAIFASALLLWRIRAEKWALALALAGWACLGALALTLHQQSRPANIASDLIEAGKLDSSQPLRWRGILRENPEQLPWGTRFTLDLDEVEVAGQPEQVSGGLRASYFGSDSSSAMKLRAGDRVELLAQARLPRNYKDPGAFDHRGQLERQGIELTASLRSLSLVTPLPGHSPALRHRMARLRGLLLERVDTLYAAAPQQAAVLRAMILGDKSFVDSDVSEAFRKTSSYHVLVIAGLHVAALAAFVVWCCSRLRIGRLASSCVSMATLGAYLAIVQDRPPILRATLMAGAYLLARGFYRRLDILQTVCLAALLILFFRPGELGDPSFQLSFLAVAAIGGIAVPWLEGTAEPIRLALRHITDVTRDPGLRPRLVQLRLDLRGVSNAFAKKLPARLASRASGIVTLPLRAGLLLWETFVISAVIQLGLMPLLIEEFHRVGIVGLLANIPAVLLTAIIVPLGFAALGLSFVSMTVAHAVARFAGGAVVLLLKAVSWFASFRLGNFRTPSMPFWLTAAFFVLLLFLAGAVRMRIRIGQSVALAAVVLCAIAAAVHPTPARVMSGKLELTVIDVGQGDSLFLAAPDGHAMLIDGGGGPGPLRVGGVQTRFDVGEEVVSRFLWSRGVKHLDVVALTHAHEDHLEGLFAVLENFRVTELWVGHDVSSATYRRLLHLATARGTKIIHLQRGDSFAWGALHGTVLWPDTISEVSQATNDDSLVFRIQYLEQSIMLTGDMEKPVERALVDDGGQISAGFLKVPHHGSSTSSTAPLLERVHPAFAAISVGENNPFNFPTAAVMGRLHDEGAQIFRTDIDGAITLTSDGKTERVTCFGRTPPTVGTRLYESLLR